MYVSNTDNNAWISDAHIDKWDISVTRSRKVAGRVCQGCSLGLDVSVSRRSRDVVSKRLGLVSVSWKRGNVSVSISSRTENQMSRSRLGLVP